jgi:hypothetical protein
MIFHVCSNLHSVDFNKGKDYMWIFKDSIKNDIDTNYRFSWIKKRDICNHFIYKGHYLITLWDFKDLYPLDLSDASINSNMIVPDVDTDYGKGEVLNSESSPKTIIRFGITFNSKININLDDSSKIIKKLFSSNYIGFYGIVNKMSFTNESNEGYIQFVYPAGKMLTILLLYKTENRFYVLIVETNDNINYKFDDNIIDIFNLK